MDHLIADFQIIFQRIQFISNKVNSGLKFILVISGDLTIETNSRFYSLEEKDFIIINPNQLYQIRGSANNCVLLLDISDTFIEQYYPDYRKTGFDCYSREEGQGREAMIGKIRKLLAEVVITYLRKDESYRIEIQGLICQILLILIRRFKHEGQIFRKIDTDDQRLDQITAYLEKNYDQPISQESVARRFYLSTSYLSRYFKQKLGIGFSQYLMNIRLTHSLKDLLYTSHSISQISMDNGFPNTKSFTDLFKKLYGETPRTYREKHKEQTSDVVHTFNLEDKTAPINSPDILRPLALLLRDEDSTYSNTDAYFDELRLDLHSPDLTRLHYPAHNLIIGDLKNIFREDVRSQILTVQEELGLTYIGVMHLLNETLISPVAETDETIATSSPFFALDAALNFLKKNGLSLFVHIDYREIVINEESYFNQLKKLLNHCLQFYGEDYLSSWLFMFSEPSGATIPAKESSRVYLKLNHLLKEKVQGIQVGAYLPFSRDEISYSHSWLLKENANVDFFGFDANQNEVIDFSEMDNEHFLLTKDYIRERTNHLKMFLKQSHIEKPLHLVAWNTLSGDTRYTNGIFFRGALVLKNALDVAQNVNSLGFWINTELHEKENNSRLIQIEGLELFYYFSGKRPAYYAMVFFKKLRGKIIAQGAEFIMTKTELGYQLVLMNCNNVNPYLSQEETFLQKLNIDLHVTISGLEPGEYQIRKHIFDKDHGALYIKWLNLNSKHGLDEEIIEHIKRISHPELEVSDEYIAVDWSFYSYLLLNAIHFFDIRKVRP